MGVSKNNYMSWYIDRGENINEKDIEKINEYLFDKGVSLSVEEDADGTTIKIFKEDN